MNNKIEKPKYCGQEWLNMSPTSKGRMCGQCSKIIIDFSKMKWSEIEKIQGLNNNSACGMYTEKQLKYWGKEVPQNTGSKFISPTTLLLSLTSSIELVGQVSNSKDTGTYKKNFSISGTITGKSSINTTDTLASSVIQLKNTNIGTVSDSNGYYTLNLTDYIDSIQNPILVFSFLGFETIELPLTINLQDELKYNVELKNVEHLEIEGRMTHFYVSKPTTGQRIKWRIRNLFKSI